jgi:hypothetical protein
MGTTESFFLVRQPRLEFDDFSKFLAKFMSPWKRKYIADPAEKDIKKNSVALVRKRTIPTKRPPLVGEVSANFCG